MKRLFAGMAWLSLSAGVILTGVAGLQAYYLYTPPMTISQPTEVAPIYVPQDTPRNGQIKGVESLIETTDGRALVVAEFLRRHNSPLEPHDHYGQVFVDIADRYGFDFRLLPAIAMQESGLCKFIPEASYNCLGFGVHERGTLAFENFEANFERAGRELKAYYINEGRTTPETIMQKYTPSSNGSWAESVNQWMSEMRYNDRALGRDLNETDANVLEFAKETPQAVGH